MTLPIDLLDRPAVISECGTYRYWLRRALGSRLLGELLGRPKPICFLMHNPSKADAQLNDPTVRRCIGYVERWGGSELIVVNRYAYRSTDPEAIFDTAKDPIGPDNDEAICRAVAYCHAYGGFAVAAWGSPAGSSKWRRQHLADRSARIVGELTSRGLPLHVLGLSQDGTPRHPLYLKGDLQPVRWA